jgi:Leucine-rich repeat (LRR) protein
VTLSGTPQRVTGLALASGNLNGTIPAGLGRLHGLTSLDLSGNALTGSIPAVLGDLPGLATLRMSGNSLSGCIPVALRDLETNDLATLGISFCDMLTPPTLSE